MTTISEIYSIRPPKVFTYAGEASCVNPTQIIGIELETEGCQRGFEWYQEKLGKTLGIALKEDGSLRNVGGAYAYEFITRPTSSSQSLKILEEFFKITGFGEANYSDRCSTHVHANVCDMTSEQVSNVALIYTVVEPILFEFVNNRPGNKDGWSRDTNIYCIPWNQCRDHLDLINELINKPGTTPHRWQKYTALNLIPMHRFGTIEFRHMHGTADMDKLTKWINIIGGIMKYAKEHTLAELSADISNLNTVSHYEKFFREVLQNQLPYNENYRQLLEEGAILAKYSMQSWKAPKKEKDTYKSLFTEAPPIARAFVDEEDEREDFEARLPETPPAWAPPDAPINPGGIWNTANPLIRAAQAEVQRAGARAAPVRPGPRPWIDPPPTADVMEAQMAAMQRARDERERQRAALRRAAGITTPTRGN